MQQRPPDTAEAALFAYKRTITNLTIWGVILALIGAVSVVAQVIFLMGAEERFVVVPSEFLLLLVGLYALRFKEALTFAFVGIVSLFARLPETIVQGLGTFEALLNLLVFAVLLGQFFAASSQKKRYEALSKEKLPATTEGFSSLASTLWAAAGILCYGGYLLLRGTPFEGVVGSLTLITAVMALGFGLSSLLANLEQRVLAISGVVVGIGLLVVWIMTIASTNNTYLVV